MEKHFSRLPRKLVVAESHPRSWHAVRRGATSAPPFLSGSVEAVLLSSYVQANRLGYIAGTDGHHLECCGLSRWGDRCEG